MVAAEDDDDAGHPDVAPTDGAASEAPTEDLEASPQGVAPTTWEQLILTAGTLEPVLVEALAAGPCPSAVPTLLRLAELVPKALHAALALDVSAVATAAAAPRAHQ